MKNLVRFAAATALVAVPVSAVHADEGMWTFDAFPAAKMRAAYGWAPDQAWLNRTTRGHEGFLNRLKVGDDRLHVRSGCDVAIR